jgi:hypothetical protein
VEDEVVFSLHRGLLGDSIVRSGGMRTKVGKWAKTLGKKGACASALSVRARRPTFVCMAATSRDQLVAAVIFVSDEEVYPLILVVSDGQWYGSLLSTRLLILPRSSDPSYRRVCTAVPRLHPVRSCPSPTTSRTRRCACISSSREWSSQTACRRRRRARTGHFQGMQKRSGWA